MPSPAAAALRPGVGPPAAGVLGLAAAFPSLAHSWLKQVIRRMMLPTGFLNFIDGICHLNIAFTSVGGSLVALFSVLRGVLQGFPLSGYLFAWAIDPTLAELQSRLDARGLAVTRACADDVGAAVRALTTFRIFEDIFSWTRLRRARTSRARSVSWCRWAARLVFRMLHSFASGW